MSTDVEPWMTPPVAAAPVVVQEKPIRIAVGPVQYDAIERVYLDGGVAIAVESLGVLTGAQDAESAYAEAITRIEEEVERARADLGRPADAEEQTLERHERYRREKAATLIDLPPATLAEALAAYYAADTRFADLTATAALAKDAAKGAEKMLAFARQAVIEAAEREVSPRLGFEASE